MRKNDKPGTAMPHLVGAMIIFLMLLVFHQVLKVAVQQGASNNIAYTQRGRRIGIAGLSAVSEHAKIAFRSAWEALVRPLHRS